MQRISLNLFDDLLDDLSLGHGSFLFSDGDSGQRLMLQKGQLSRLKAFFRVLYSDSALLSVGRQRPIGRDIGTCPVELENDGDCLPRLEADRLHLVGPVPKNVDCPAALPVNAVHFVAFAALLGVCTLLPQVSGQKNDLVYLGSHSQSVTSACDATPGPATW